MAFVVVEAGELIAFQTARALEGDAGWFVATGSCAEQLGDHSAELWEGEPLLRECLAIREDKRPDEWSTWNTKSMLGAALLGQKQFAEAEKLLLAGYEGMKHREAKIPPPGKIRLTEANQRLVDLYTQWDKPAEAAKWQALLPPSATEGAAPKPDQLPKKD